MTDVRNEPRAVLSCSPYKCVRDVPITHVFPLVLSSNLTPVPSRPVLSRTSPYQALRHPWVLDGKLYSGSGGSSSDGSEFSVGAGGIDDDPRAPDPQDIPSELLGADSDTEEEQEEEERDGGSREWKEGGDAGGWRPGYRATSKAPSAVVVVAAPSGRRSDRGGVVDKRGGGVTTAAAKGTNAPVLPKTAPPAPPPPPPTPAAAATTAGELGGIKEEDTGEPSTGPDGAGLAGEPAPAAAGTEEPKASQPPPAPPAPPPPPPRAPDGALSSKSSGDAGRGQLRSGESDRVGVLETRVPPAGERVVAGGKGGSGGGVEVEGGRRSAEAEAEAAAEEAVTAEEAAADMAAMKAAAVAAAVTAAAKAAQSPSPSPPSSSLSASLPASPPPLAPVVNAAQPPFVTPRKLRSPRPLDVFSSPPLAPVGSGRAVEDDSEFSLDAGPALPPERGPARSREGLPPAGPSSRGEGASAFPLGVVERQLSMGVAGISLAEAEAAKREGVVAAAPPAFHDLVKRSTRFMTSGGREAVGMHAYSVGMGIVFFCFFPLVKPRNVEPKRQGAEQKQSVILFFIWSCVRSLGPFALKRGPMG